MRCARCEFENIPGQTRCIRCGSILEAGSAVLEIYPPRMPAWKKPFRGALRWFRGGRLMRERSPAPWLRRGFRPIMSDSMVGLVLSVIPGLAHLLAGRFREVRLLVVLWLVLLGTGVFLYGSQIGSLLVGLAIGIHAWIAVRYGLFKEVGDFMARVGAIVIIVLLLAALYWGVPRLVPPGLSGGHTALTIPAMNVHSGDYFLVRRLARRDDPLPRGALVLTQPQGYRNVRHRQLPIRGQRMIGQVVGLPGEIVRVEGNTYIVRPLNASMGPAAAVSGTSNEQRLDPNRFPVPRWLQGRLPQSGLPVPSHSYFVSSQYTLNVHGNVGGIDQMVTSACVLEVTSIRGRAFVHWWPLSRRGFLQ
jgi:hypothetical protein